MLYCEANTFKNLKNVIGMYELISDALVSVAIIEDLKKTLGKGN